MAQNADWIDHIAPKRSIFVHPPQIFAKNRQPGRSLGVYDAARLVAELLRTIRMAGNLFKSISVPDEPPASA
jgi:hypothetical protein